MQDTITHSQVCSFGSVNELIMYSKKTLNIVGRTSSLMDTSRKEKERLISLGKKTKTIDVETSEHVAQPGYLVTLRCWLWSEREFIVAPENCHMTHWTATGFLSSVRWYIKFCFNILPFIKETLTFLRSHVWPLSAQVVNWLDHSSPVVKVSGLILRPKCPG